jgi:hypothetical protein
VLGHLSNSLSNGFAFTFPTRGIDRLIAVMLKSLSWPCGLSTVRNGDAGPYR